MKTTAILDLMIKDHNRLMEFLKDVENNLGRDFGFLSKSFNVFQWNLEKHFFVEERAIFTACRPEHINAVYEIFSNLSMEHTVILELLDSLRNKLQKREPFDLFKLKELLVKHKNFEEKNVYPILDQEIDKNEKRFIIKRINDIIRED